jgi:hypothetical protein
LSLEVSCSIQLSYRGVVRDTRVELVSSVWKTDILTDIRIPPNRGNYNRNKQLITFSLLALGFVEDGDIGAQAVEALRQVFITAVDGVDVAQH